jgi:transcriptional regulator with XRE-family HTH domain
MDRVLTREQEIRLAAGVSLTAAAALANVSPGTARSYELNRTAVTPLKRRALDAAYQELARRSRTQPAA